MIVLLEITRKIGKIYFGHAQVIDKGMKFEPSRAVSKRNSDS